MSYFRLVELTAALTEYNLLISSNGRCERRALFPLTCYNAVDEQTKAIDEI